MRSLIAGSAFDCCWVFCLFDEMLLTWLSITSLVHHCLIAILSSTIPSPTIHLWLLPTFMLTSLHFALTHTSPPTSPSLANNPRSRHVTHTPRLLHRSCPASLLFLIDLHTRYSTPLTIDSDSTPSFTQSTCLLTEREEYKVHLE